eukprot:c10152_g1_i1.p1 GENE.c10152_g1_i1~~c10152_g1_i1.p1  ORF type:complete len:153 (-),score=19.67 c10152_g1_i1:255-713(-)
MKAWEYYALGGASIFLCLVAIACALVRVLRGGGAVSDEEKQALMQKRPRGRRPSRTASMVPTTQTEFNTKLNASGLPTAGVPIPEPTVAAIRSQQRDYFGVSPSEALRPSEFVSRSMLERMAPEDGKLPSSPEWKTETVVTLAPSSLNSTYY